jgi:CxxC motif-containing protein (DUF1111 family)
MKQLATAAAVTLSIGAFQVHAQTIVADRLTTAREAPREAPTGFDGDHNGMVDAATFALDLEAFDGAEEVDEGLGPVYNAQACRECHQAPISGAGSQITELRVGHLDRRGNFVNPAIPMSDGSVVRDRSLIADRTICPNGTHPQHTAQQRVPASENIRALRVSLSTLGDGFIEAIPSVSLLRLAEAQCRRTNGRVCGQIVAVPVLEAQNQLRVGRFGWKGQHASLVSFAADAYLNEMGITNELLREDVTPLCDTVADPEDAAEDDHPLGDVDRFARFMRATKAPPRDAALAANSETRRGEALFSDIGCATCHTPTHLTAPAGSVVNAGAFVVPAALGNKIIHPYSDFLLHDVGTGDGIVQNGPQSTARKLRTPPLWGLRVKSRFMHDAKPTSLEEAVLRHGNEAGDATRAYQSLSSGDQQRLVQFLRSL